LVPTFASTLCSSRSANRTWICLRSKNIAKQIHAHGKRPYQHLSQIENPHARQAPFASGNSDGPVKFVRQMPRGEDGVPCAFTAVIQATI
jgi:hypothetical protein